MIKNIKGIGPIVAITLLIVVAVGSVISFQGWFNNYSSNVFNNVENKTPENFNNNIERLIDTTLYIKNSNVGNITINKVKLGNIDCNISEHISPGITEIDLSDCLSNISTGTIQDVSIFTDSGIEVKTFFIKSLSGGAACSDPNLISENIKSGVTILDVTGNYSFSDSNLLPENIKSGVTIFGVTGNYTSVLDYDPFYSNHVILLMYMNGANLSTNFSDEKNNVVNSLGTSKITTSLSKFNGSSLLLSGGDSLYINNYITNKLGTFSGNMITFEGWIRPTSFSSANGYGHTIFSNYASVASDGRWLIQVAGSVNGSYRLNFIYTTSTASQLACTGTQLAYLNNWSHFAVVIDARTPSNSTINLFLNGINTTCYTQNLTSQNVIYERFRIGGNTAYSNDFNGTIDDIRITKTLRYTSNFTPPTSSFYNY